MRRTLASIHAVLLLACSLLVATAGSAGAQLIAVPQFLVLDWNVDDRFGYYSIAAGEDSSMAVMTWQIFYQTDDAQARLQRLSPSGSLIGGLTRIDTTNDVRAPRIIADTRGGFLVNWGRNGKGLNLPLVAGSLDASGIPSGPLFTVSNGIAVSSTSAALPSGSVFAWRNTSALLARRFDVAGQPIGPEITVHEFDAQSGPGWIVLAAKADGGFVVVWSGAGRSLGRVYDAAGQPQGDVTELATEFELYDVAASPLGGFVVVGRRLADTHIWRSGVWARRFDDAGTPLGPSFVVDFLNPEMTAWPHAAFDPAGRLYVVWGVSGNDPIPPQGRAYDAAGRPLHDAFRLSLDDAREVLLTPRPDGRFIEGSISSADLYLQVRALCVPPFHTGCGDGVAQSPCERCDQGAANSDTEPNACRTTCALAACGDGVVDAGESCDDGNLVGCDGCDSECELEPGYQCGDGVVSTDCNEQCDDGPGNDDTLPNACRTDCRAAHCTDGVVDAGEGCDDGNGTSCDGCSDLCVPEPGLVCGDGIPELRCGEECDDGNGIVGDGCADACRLERVPGGGSPTSDCKVEWVVDNAANVPLLDKSGWINGVQTCQDGDPRCDFDAVAGRCTFHLRVCANNTNVPACVPGPRLRSWELRAPSANKAAKRPELAAVRAAFSTVPGAIIGPITLDVCSPTLAVPIQVKASGGGAKPGSLILKSYATLFTGEKDSDKLRLICLP